MREYHREYYLRNKDSSSTNIVKIYRLIYEDRTIYVGRTKLTLKRRKGSSNTSVPSDIYKQSKIELIEETEYRSRERFWIEYYRSIGEPILNKRGGDFD